MDLETYLKHLKKAGNNLSVPQNRVKDFEGFKIPQNTTDSKIHLRTASKSTSEQPQRQATIPHITPSPCLLASTQIAMVRTRTRDNERKSAASIPQPYASPCIP